MAYVRGGNLREQKHESALSLGFVVDAVWSVVNQVGHFFHTMISIEATENYVNGTPSQGRATRRTGATASARSTGYRVGSAADRPGVVRRGVHGMNNVRGLSHSAAAGGA